MSQTRQHSFIALIPFLVPHQSTQIAPRNQQVIPAVALRWIRWGSAFHLIVPDTASRSTSSPPGFHRAAWCLRRCLCSRCAASRRSWYNHASMPPSQTSVLVAPADQAHAFFGSRCTSRSHSRSSSYAARSSSGVVAIIEPTTRLLVSHTRWISS